MGRAGAGNKFNTRQTACPSGRAMAKFQWLSNEQQRIQTTSLTFFHRGRLMKALTQYGRMAEKHWREHCPKLVRDLEAQGQLHAMLLEAEEKTKDEMIELTQQFKIGRASGWERV